ncbi:hypothetical protein BLOT_009488 [Blomia tropicalis]|nr:hypothetical protein BLOT_009488 [Blomia tropicalis]
MEKLPRRFPYLRIHLLLNLCKLILVNLEYTQKYEPYCPRHRLFSFIATKKQFTNQLELEFGNC